MKTAVAITLVVCGTIIIGLPPAADFLYNQAVAQVLLEKQGATSVTLPAQMGDKYRFGCWLLGAATIASAILLSMGKPQAIHSTEETLSSI